MDKIITHMKSIFLKLKTFYYKSSNNRFVQYLRNKGMIIGNNTTFLAPIHTFIDEGRAKFIKIGNDCVICRNVTLIAHDYSWTILLKAYNEFLPSGGGKIIIGDNVFIGEGATILRNVTIGDNSIVAAGAVVTKDIPPNSVYGGNPAHFIMSLDDYYAKRKKLLHDEIFDNFQTLATQGEMNLTQLESEMKNFRPLYLSRTTQNEFIFESGFAPIGISKDKIKELFESTINTYDSFIDFYEKEYKK